MNYAQMRQFDVANGVGIRSTLFLSGCSFHCPGCFNAEYQDFKYGTLWTKESEDQFISYLQHPRNDGASILGGEPFQQDEIVFHSLLRRIKEETNKSIWVWTGYQFEDLVKNRQNDLQYIDVIVDGQFIENLRDMRLQFRGSSNQRIIDVQKSLQENKMILWGGNM